MRCLGTSAARRLDDPRHQAHRHDDQTDVTRGCALSECAERVHHEAGGQDPSSVHAAQLRATA